ncbi:pyruvate, phosphate dikinase [Candidatus Pacearchaeota archaeon]|nr:pyruvate, phosphate dikinase [Candidatus Pacearchaeota archaeon]MBD3282987.1 pyruvate, phosphate dikinase [Candidatus Pacearchaeota archaeon]
MTEKFVYSFKEGNKEMKELLGGKGANLAEMTSLGIPVPPGFTITTKACQLYYEDNKRLNEDVKNQIYEKLLELERDIGKKLGDEQEPLLVSVRSGAAVSMPGMMDTVLNLGLNDKTVIGLGSKTGNDRFAFDSYRRFIQMFGNVVMGVKSELFEEILSKVKSSKGIKFDKDLGVDDLKKLIAMYKQLIEIKTGKLFPDNVHEQLYMAINAVFESWNNERAISYRRLNNIHGLIGTAVNIQTMVFGNMGDDSGTGVCFTRNPSNGDNNFYGEFLMNAQGEDVVAGIRTPEEIDKLGEIMPGIYNQLLEIRDKLEIHYKDMQDIEFTIQEDRLYVLQTRNGKRTAQAAVKIAVEMVEQGLINRETAVLRVEPESLNQLLHKQIDPNFKSNSEILSKGLPASPGAAVGKIVFNADDAQLMMERGESSILVRIETSPEDIEGMNAAQGILTSRGGMTSHAAVVARGMGKCCVAGCSELIIDENKRTFEVSGKVLREGDIITLDGSTGEVFSGSLKLIEPSMAGDFGKLMQWADELKKLGVRTNSDTPKDASVALKFGAQGIGLCRTEHMFFEESRIKAVREMILAEDVGKRKQALSKILPMQKNDFKDLFKIMDNRPIIIRLLDPPLHEFLPKDEKGIHSISSEVGVSPEKIKEKIEELHEFNPMLGHRGCRLAISYPEIAEMQVIAIFEAALEVIEEGITPLPEIEVPLAGNVKEFLKIKDIVKKVADEMNINGRIKYKVGTMIEVPRAAITADEFAKDADFMSFGTNDLTQMGCGFSRDDSGSFLKEYVYLGIYKRDPFQSIDQEGIGKLMQICVEKARAVNPKIEIGICGEHGGEQESVKFCHRIGLNDVSCSPYRVPIARLSAAQAAVEEKKQKEEQAYKELVKKSVSSLKSKFGESIRMDDLEKELYVMINTESFKR